MTNWTEWYGVKDRVVEVVGATNGIGFGSG